MDIVIGYFVVCQVVFANSLQNSLQMNKIALMNKIAFDFHVYMCYSFVGDKQTILLRV